jgi:hypothetical protein
MLSLNSKTKQGLFSELSGAQEDLANDRSKTAVTRVKWRGRRMEYGTHGWFGGLGLKTIGGRFHGFGPQNPGEGSEEERTTRDGIEEFAPRRSYLMMGAVAVG